MTSSPERAERGEGKRAKRVEGKPAQRVDGAMVPSLCRRRTVRHGAAHAERTTDDVIVLRQLQFSDALGHFLLELLLGQLDIRAERVVEHVGNRSAAAARPV